MNIHCKVITVVTQVTYKVPGSLVKSIESDHGKTMENKKFKYKLK